VIPLRIEGATARFVSSDPSVRPLFVLETDDAFVSRWEPTPDELALLIEGGSVELWICARFHPPVTMKVVPHAPEETDP
jgi:hypothetical protein